MWLLPGENKDVNQKSTSPALGEDDDSGSALDNSASQSEITKKIEIPKFSTEYPKSTTLNHPTSDLEWPMKEPVVLPSYTYGWNVGKRGNLHVLSSTCVVFVSGGTGVIHDFPTNTQTFLQPSVDCCITQIAVHPSKAFIACGEKGLAAGCNIFEYPSLRLVVKLRCEGEKEVLQVHFNREGSHLLTITPAPNYVLTVWDWENEVALARAKASHNYPICRTMFSLNHSGVIVSSGIDHIRFWRYQSSDQGWQLSSVNGAFGNRATSTIESFAVLALGSVITASSDGTVLKWVDGSIETEVLRDDGEKLHDGEITDMLCCGRDLITMGTDGFIKKWSWDQLEGPIGADGLLLTPIWSHKLEESDVPTHMVPTGETSSWFVLTGQGKVLLINADTGSGEMTVKTLLYTHCGSVTGIAGANDEKLFATVGEDGNVRIFSDDLRYCVASSPGKGVACTTVLWITPKDSNGSKMLSVGYEDGTIRIYVIGELLREVLEEGQCYYRQAPCPLYELKSHRWQVGHILHLDLNEENAVLGSISSDSTLLLLSLKVLEGIPIALYRISSPASFTWKRIGQQCLISALIGCESGLIIEVELPTQPQDATLVPPMDATVLADDRSLKLLRDLPHRSHEFKSVKASLQKVDGDIPAVPSRVAAAIYNENDPEFFWVSTQDFDAGYLYKFSFGSDRCESHVRLHNIVDLTVSRWCFLDSGHMMMAITTNGFLLLLVLREHFVIDNPISIWMMKTHQAAISGFYVDRNYGVLITASLDGGAIRHSLNVPDTTQALIDRRLFKEILATIQTTSMDDAEEKEFLEAMKQDGYERELALRENKAMSETVEALVKQIRSLMAENESLPEGLRIPQTEFIVHEDVRGIVEAAYKRRIAEADGRTIFERARGRMIQERLLTYLLGDREKTIECTLLTFDGESKVSTYAVQKIEDDLEQQIHNLEKAKQLKEKTDELAGETKKEADQVVAVTGSTFGSSVHENRYASNMLANSLDSKSGWEQARYAEHLERSQERRKEWRELLNQKPNLAEKNEEFLSSERKRLSKQEYRVKLDPEQSTRVMANYKNSSDVELQFLKTRLAIYEEKKKFNKRVEELREEKLSTIQSLRALDTQLAELHRHLPEEKRKFLPAVYDLEPCEGLDQCSPPTREECVNEYETRQQTLNKKEQNKTPFRDDQLPEPLGDPEEEAEWKKKHKFARLQSFATRQSRASQMQALLPTGDSIPSAAKWLELSYEMSKEEMREHEIKLSSMLHEQEMLLEEGQKLRILFDGKLRLLRHDKINMDIEVKKAEISLSVLKWEHRVLKEFEVRETDMAQEELKLIERRDAIAKKIRHIEPDIKALQDRLKSMRDIEDSIKLEYDIQLKQVLNPKRFRKLLTNILYHNIKGFTAEGNPEESRECIYEIDAPIGSQIQCSVSSIDFPSAAFMTRSSLKWTRKLRKQSRLRRPKSRTSLPEFDPTDVYKCPRDLDKRIFQAVHALNKDYQRIRQDIDEELVVNQSLITASEQAKEELSFVEFELSRVSEGLDKLRREKFKKWKAIPSPVVLHGHQLNFNEATVSTADLLNALYFDRKELDRLNHLIESVNAEAADDAKQLISLKNEYDTITREKILFTSRIENLREECRKTMEEKLGGFLDLDLANQVRTDPQIQELKNLLDQEKRAHEEAKKDYMKQATELRQQITEKRTEIARTLKELEGQMKQRDALEKQAIDRAHKIGRGVLENSVTEDLQDNRDQLVMWETIAEMQQAEIDALETQLAIMQRKDIGLTGLATMSATGCDYSAGDETRITDKFEDPGPTASIKPPVVSTGVFKSRSDLYLSQVNHSLRPPESSLDLKTPKSELFLSNLPTGHSSHLNGSRLDILSIQPGAPAVVVKTEAPIDLTVDMATESKTIISNPPLQQFSKQL